MGWALDPVHSSVDFAVKHMVIATVRGRFPKFEADVDLDEAQPERSSVSVRIDAASIDTKDERRDAHLRSADFLHAEQFPWILFQSKRIEGGPDEGQYKLIGDLTIRDVTREVALNAEFGVMKDPRGNQKAGFSAETAINRQDFGLT